MTIGNDLVVLGYQVMASVEGATKQQPISQRFTSESAANAYKDLAVKSGFKDAFVTSVTGFEKSEPIRKEKKKIEPRAA